MPHKVALNLETKKERLERKGKAAVSNDYHGVFGAEQYFRSEANTKATNVGFTRHYIRHQLS